VIQLLGYALIAVIVAGLLFYLVVALLPQGLTVEAERDVSPPQLPANRLVTSSDLVAMRLPVVLRGYRMADTDDLIDRLTLEIAVRDRELARLRDGSGDDDAAEVLVEPAADAGEPGV
jgi:hypothetical protein